MAWTTVITHATGDVFPASDWNTYVRDNFAYLHGDAGNVDLSAGAASYNFSSLSSVGNLSVPAAVAVGSPNSAAGVGVSPLGQVSVSRASGSVAFSTTVPGSGDTNMRFTVDTNGGLSWGPGSTGADASLSRIASGVLWLGNKQLESYVNTSGGATTWTPSLNAGMVNRYNMTGAGTLTVSAPTLTGGSLTGKAGLLGLCVHNATGGSITVAWNAIYGGVLPASVGAGQTLYCLFFYNDGDTRWASIGSATF
jgi:hypothetical protein